MTARSFRRALPALVIAFILLAPPGRAEESKDAGKKHFLWKVSSRTSTVYLVGSIHLLRQSDYPLDPVYEHTYADSRTIFFEVNPSAMDEQKIRRVTTEKGMYAAQQSLSTALSKSTLDAVKPRLAGMGVNIEQAERMRPWLLSLVLAVAELQRLGYDADHGLDRYFMNKAAKDGKKTGGFETAEYQVNLLANMPDAMQEQMLLQTLQDLRETEQYFGEMAATWQQGNAKGLEAFLLKSFREYPAIYQSLIVERNRNWLPVLEELLRQKENTMVVVGAAHLVGKGGIIAELSRTGYRVEQQ